MCVCVYVYMCMCVNVRAYACMCNSVHDSDVMYAYAFNLCIQLPICEFKFERKLYNIFMPSIYFYYSNISRKGMLKLITSSANLL